jgi:hypothetical protein
MELTDVPGGIAAAIPMFRSSHDKKARAAPDLPYTMNPQPAEVTCTRTIGYL